MLFLESIGYLIPVSFLAWCTYFVLAPPNWPRRLTSFSSYFNVINELPFLALLWLGGITWLTWAQEGFRSPLSWVAAGVALLTVVGQILIIQRALKTAPAVNQGLDAGLGKGWRVVLDHRMIGQLQKTFVAKGLLGPFFLRHSQVERVADISYGNAGVRNKLDLYRLRSHPKNCPILIHLHGGSYVSGRKSTQSLPLLNHLASHGWVCISANYRLRPDARFPDHLIDAKQVIAWTREHAEEYGMDPSTIIIAGNSAGGHLAAMVALTPNDPLYQPGFEEVDTSVTAAVCLFGYYGFVETRVPRSSSPMGYGTEETPPFLVMHGDTDKIVRVDDARRFVSILRQISSQPVVYVELPYGEHNFDMFHSLRAEAAVHGIEAFTAWVRAKDS